MRSQLNLDWSRVKVWSLNNSKTDLFVLPSLVSLWKKGINAMDSTSWQAPMDPWTRPNIHKACGHIAVQCFILEFFLIMWNYNFSKQSPAARIWVHSRGHFTVQKWGNKKAIHWNDDNWQALEHGKKKEHFHEQKEIKGEREKKQGR